MKRRAFSIVIALALLATHAFAATWTAGMPGPRRQNSSGRFAYDLPSTSGDWSFRATLLLQEAKSDSAFLAIANKRALPEKYGGTRTDGKWGAEAVSFGLLGSGNFVFWEGNGSGQTSVDHGLQRNVTFSMVLSFTKKPEGGGILSLYLNGAHHRDYTLSPAYSAAPLDMLFFCEVNSVVVAEFNDYALAPEEAQAIK